MKAFNRINVIADKLAYGKWAKLNKEYFANQVIINELYNFVEHENIEFNGTIKIIDLGSADGLVGEYFARKLGVRQPVSLTILDIVQEHLNANKNTYTKKLRKDLIDFHERGKYDLGIMVSVLHYFSTQDQVTILKNIHGCLTHTGMFVLKAFIQHAEIIDLFSKLNKLVGKNLKLINENQLLTFAKRAGYSEVRLLGDATTWNCTFDNLQKRYNLTDDKLAQMANLIKAAPKRQNKYFYLSGKKFSIPIPYKVYLLKK